MSERAFLLPDAKRRTTEAIRAIESQTSAEVVVTVRHAAGRHLTTSLVFGVCMAALALFVMLVSPQVYDVRTIPLDVLVTFVLAALLCHFVPSLKRLLTPARRRIEAARGAAHSAFAELGIAKTKSRNGVLVFVALLERTAVVVADEGVPTALLGQAYDETVASLSNAVTRLDFEAFSTALERLGPLFAAVLPRRPDDENELCDDVA